MGLKSSFQGKVRTGWTILAIIILVSMLFGACAPQKPKVYRVGILSGLSYFSNLTDGLKWKMTELGYVEGTNIVYDVQKTEIDIPAYQKILKKFVDDKVDLIIAFPTEAIMEAKTATKGTKIPLVFAFVPIEGMGIVDSVRKPGGNITGVRLPGVDITVKRFEVLHGIAPQAKRIFVPYLKDYPIVPPELEGLRKAAQTAGVTLIESPVASPAELEASIQAHASEIDAFLMIVEPITLSPDGFTVLGKFAYEHKLPIGGAYVKFGEYSSLFGIMGDNVETGKQAALLVDKILKGANAGEMPVVSSENFMQVDMQAAQKMGVTVPESVLRQANQVIR
jgi:putative tryptophan/tyrosine transport system substrate-binding protein